RPLSGATPPTVRAAVNGAEGDVTALVAPVVVRERIAGYLALIGPVPDEWSDEDYLALERGSAVCALELAKQQAVSEAERRLRGDFFEDLLSEHGDAADSLVSRARHLGLDVLQPLAVLVVATADSGAAEILGAARAFLT